MERTCGQEKIQLLRAPSIESDVMWKQQCFEMIYNRLRSKLSDYSADVVISVFNEHFPLSTISTEQEARRIVHAIPSSFSDVKNLTPTAFLDRNRNNQTSTMHKTPRPSNICHLGVGASISMESLSEAFEKNSEFILKYYLELPQSFYAAYSSNLSNSVSQRASKSSNSSADNPNKPTSALPRETSVSEPTPEENAENAVNLTDGASQGEPKNNSDSIIVDQNKTEHNETHEPNIPTLIRTNKNDDNSNSSFDFNVQAMFNPKAAALVLENRFQSCSNQSVYMYHGTIGVLDNQQAFIDIIPAWHDMYNLSPEPTGTLTVPNRKSLHQRLDKAADAVQFRVFCYKFRKAYIGDDDAQKTSEALTISTCGKSPRKINMSYRDYTTKQVIAITPDKVFQKMMEYVSFLPKDASAWEFFLLWIYFQAFTIGLQEDLRDSGYSLPPPYPLLTKTAQVRAMTLCRDEARKATRE